jgi:hypothetical protein
MPNEQGKKLHILTLIEVDAGCGLQSRFFCFGTVQAGCRTNETEASCPGRVKKPSVWRRSGKTDGYGFCPAIRDCKMLDLYWKLVVRQAGAGQRIAQRLNPLKMLVELPSVTKSQEHKLTGCKACSLCRIPTFHA